MFKIYFAGELFDHKHILGNKILAQRIEAAANNIYKCILPQNWEGALDDIIDIRNNDLKAIIEADFVLFNFDGPDLDSGTAVEFIIAKMLDIPAILLRTDSRGGGHLANEDWNLMVAGYPRCVVVRLSGLELYNTVGLDGMEQKIVESILIALQKVQAQPSVMSSYEEIWTAYQHVIKMSGGNLEKIVPVSLLREIIIAKGRKGIYSSFVAAAEPSLQDGAA